MNHCQKLTPLIFVKGACLYRLMQNRGKLSGIDFGNVLLGKSDCICLVFDIFLKL